MDKSKVYYVALVMRKADRTLLDELWKMSDEYDLDQIVGIMSDWTGAPPSEIWSRILRVLASYVRNFINIRQAFRWINTLDPTLFAWCYCYLARKITTDKEIVGWLEEIENMRPYKGVEYIRRSLTIKLPLAESSKKPDSMPLYTWQ